VIEAAWSPPPAPLPPDAQAAIRRKFGLPDAPFEVLAGGFENDAYATGEFVVRVPRHPGAELDALKEAMIYAALESAGLRTPRLVGVDTDRDALPCAYTVLTRIPGRTLDGVANEAPHPRPWREAGRELARFHALAIAGLRPYLSRPDETPANLRESQLARARRKLARAAAEGALDSRLARRVETRLEALAGSLDAPFEPGLIHDDIHGSNLVVDPVCRLVAIIDFGDAFISTREGEFSACPLTALPALLAGYVEASGARLEDGASERIAALRVVRSLVDFPAASAPPEDRARWQARLVEALEVSPQRLIPAPPRSPAA
jgi:aminoglycoside phosphotransferase (APT) family kinase protein